jgi:predicted phage tail protein
MSTASRRLADDQIISDFRNDEGISKTHGSVKPDPARHFAELKYRSVDNVATAALAKKLGLFSIVLGAAEVFMPAQLGELAGISRGHRKLLPLLGLREIAHGVAILKADNPTAGVRSRLPGDALDLAFIGASFTSNDSNRTRLIGAAAAVLGVAALDLWCAKRLQSDDWKQPQGNSSAPTTVGQSSGRQA